MSLATHNLTPLPRDGERREADEEGAGNPYSVKCASFIHTYEARKSRKSPSRFARLPLYVIESASGIVTAPDAASLPPDDAVVGNVTSGIDVVERIGALGDASGQPSRPVVIESVTVEAQ